MFIWIITSPGVRFGIGIFLSFVLYISFLFASKKSNWINKNIVATTILYFIVIGLIPQINNYFSLLDNFFNTQIKNIEAPKIEYKVNNDGYGYLPEEGDQCWVNIECVRNTKVSKNKFLSYVVFNG